jgi:hypothetical protein
MRSRFIAVRTVAIVEGTVITALWLFLTFVVENGLRTTFFFDPGPYPGAGPYDPAVYDYPTAKEFLEFIAEVRAPHVLTPEEAREELLIYYHEKHRKHPSEATETLMMAAGATVASIVCWVVWQAYRRRLKVRERLVAWASSKPGKSMGPGSRR